MGGDDYDPLVKVRTVTGFIVLTKDDKAWVDIIKRAIQLNDVCTKKINSAGYDVQTLRLVTNPFGEYLDLTSEATAVAGVARLKDILSNPDLPPIRIRFAIGEARNLEELKLVPALVRAQGDLANCCLNASVDELGVPDAEATAAAAKVVQEIAETTARGEGNFNFTVNFNCPPHIPYFPAGYNTTAEGTSFALGFEHPDLLVSILQGMVPPGHKSIVTDPKTRNATWKKAFDTMLAAMESHTQKCADIAKEVSKEFNVEFAGVDSSAAPSKDAASLVQVFQLLGVENFGAAGSSEAASLLTRLFKSVKSAPLIGFSGLMLACLEDAGLAQDAIDGHYDIRALLTYSAVCGIGLDTVPIPGDTSAEKIAALMGDVGTMAYRLKKPLTVRLFPVPGLKAGDITDFKSADLCNCAVFAVP